MAESTTFAVPRRSNWTRTDLMLLAMVTIWGVNYSVIKLALRTLSPSAFTIVRFGLATLLMVIVLRRRGESLRVDRRDILPIVLLSLAGHGLYQIFFINGLARTTAANSAVLLASTPIWVAIYGQISGVERARRSVWLGIFVAFAGMILLVLGGGNELNFTGGSTIVGDVMILFSSMLWAAQSTISMPLLTRYSPVKITTLMMLIGTPVLFAVGLPSLIQTNWSTVAPIAWGGILYSAVLATVVGYVLWSTGVQRTGNARTAVYSNVTPVVSVIAAWLLLGDHLEVAQFLGAAVVLVGLVLTRRGRKG